MLLRIFEIGYTNYTLEYGIRVGVFSVLVHDAWAINQENSLREVDILPNLGFTRNRRSQAHAFRTQCVNH